MRKLVIIGLIAVAIFAVACDKKKANANTANNALPVVKKGVDPVADPDIAIIEMENPAYGTIKIELYSNIAPLMVERFKALAKEGVYDGTTFHRINDQVIQGGDPLSKDNDPSNDGTGNSDKPNVPAEFSDIKYDTGIVGAARTTDPNSANSQYFITLRRTPGFDQQYTVFGKVIDGMNNVRTIAGVQPKVGERPVEAIRIKHISIVPHDQAN